MQIASYTNLLSCGLTVSPSSFLWVLVAELMEIQIGPVLPVQMNLTIRFLPSLRCIFVCVQKQKKEQVTHEYDI